VFFIFFALYTPFLGSSMAEHAAVNRRVAGSSPARGAKEKAGYYISGFFLGVTLPKVALSAF
jgi:hypothetical protein